MRTTSYSILHLHTPENMYKDNRALINKASEITHVHFSGVPNHHGWDHLRRVVIHAAFACDSNKTLSQDQMLVVMSAALLHDADDYKLFPASKDYIHARTILEQSGYPIELREIIIDCIKLVSCSTQGESEKVPHEKWQLIPRDADRLDAIGLTGVQRCLEFSKERLLCNSSTPMPSTKEELFKAATPERFEAYKRGEKSKTTLDHFFDKLLHLTCSDSENSYLIYKASLYRDDMAKSLLRIFALIKENQRLGLDALTPRDALIAEGFVNSEEKK